MKRRIQSVNDKQIPLKLGISVGVAFVFIILCFSMYGYGKARTVDAAEQKVDTVTLRIIGTTDLHGQLNSKDYELGVDYNQGGLARVMDLIDKTRIEIAKENTITLDAGDVLYDYTTEYIFSENQNEIQPIYKAMAMIGYDAITLGNHEFDYGYEYLLRQLNGSGMRDVTVVSNLTDSKTGDYPFHEYMLITRQMTTSSGKKAEVKIGIIGHTIPTLTSKTHSYAGILRTEDMVQNAKAKAIKLKELGADVIIALSHTGIGPEQPAPNFKNVAYALTTIPEIDVVVSGHEHNLFPTADMTSPYYKLPNVDKKTSLMNGKNVIMAGDRGRAIGVVDLELDITKEQPLIINRSSELRMVTAKNTKENQTIAKSYGAWEKELYRYSTEIISELKSGEVIQNYFGLLEDNTAIQLLNNAKLQYALRFANAAGKAYKDYPTIAVSNYTSFGLKSVYDFVNIHDRITESNLSVMQPYNNYLYVYTITGKQLKEWLEWSASAYETTEGAMAWNDSTMAALIKNNGMKSLIQEQWLKDWSNFYVFDGIDYVIDPSNPPRYDFSGNKLQESRRIVSLKYNGVEVTDDYVFLLASDKITIPSEANSGVEKQAVLGGFNRSQTVLSKYMKQVFQGDSIIPPVDYNWRLKLPKDYRFIAKTPAYADELFRKSVLFKEFLTEKEEYKYYIASYPTEIQDRIGPNIIAAQAVTSATASPYTVNLSITDASAIKEIRMMKGDYDLEYLGWYAARSIKSKSFLVEENSIYSIYAEDIYGNKTIKRLVVNNFNEHMLATPTVNNYTNRKTKITGTAEPNSTITFYTTTGVYETKADSKGAFSFALPGQPSGSYVQVHSRDENRGLESETVSVLVKRTGPNQPSINPIMNNTDFINGIANDSDASVIVIVDDTVYLSEKGGRELYQKSELYNPRQKIVATYSEVDENGFYHIAIPPQEAGKTVLIYNIDHLSRISRVNSAVVEEVVPNAPVVFEVSNIEKSLSGYVPGAEKKVYDIILNLEGTIYSGKTDKTGNFSFQFTEQLYAGQMLLVSAMDQKNGSTRKSHVTQVIVADIEKYVRSSSTNLTLNRVTDKTSIIFGNYYDNGTVYLAISKGEGKSFKNTLHILQTDEWDRFRLVLDKNLEPGTVVYAMTRFVSGRILLSNKTTVLQSRPETPILLREIRNTDKLVEIIASKDCEVTLIIGKKTYTSKDYRYDERSARYIYSFETDRGASGVAVKVTAANASGVSDVLSSSVIKAAPDSPSVNPIKEGDKVITGKIELLDYSVELPNNTAIDKSQQVPDLTPESDQNTINAIDKVAITQTRIYANNGKKTYIGTIDNEGNFSIKIPRQKAGTAIKLWGTNKAGRGPLIKVVVTANPISE